MTYTFAVSRRSLPVRCLCVLLCLLVLWCFFMTPRAGAVVAEAELAYWGGAIVVSVLAAGGLALASGDAQKVGSAMWTALKDTGGKAYTSLSAMAAWAAAAGSKVKDAAFRVSSDVWDAIKNCFDKSYSDGVFSYAQTTFTVLQGYRSDDFVTINQQLSDLGINSFSLDGHHYSCSFSISGGETYYDILVDGVSTSHMVNYSLSGRLPDKVFCNLGYSYLSYKPYVNWHWICGSDFSDFGDVHFSAPCDVTFDGTITIPAPDLKYPGDDYLVKAPDLPTVDTDTGAVSWPSDSVWTKDAVAAPYPVGDDGVKVPDIPFDVPVDGTTGKALDDAGSDTDNPSKPGEGEGTETGTTAGLIGSIIELLKNFFDSPSDFRLNLDGFKNLILPDRFPFSIPFDMVKAVKLFAAAAADFVFRIDLDTQYFSVHHTVDLTPYAVPIAFFRYACVFWFAWILISRTHDLIKW